MQRLCERPGCSEVAAVAYGMRPEALVFWLDHLADVDDPAAGVLCLRHADTMVVPRNWTLDDHRDPDLHLFRPPQAPADRPPAARRVGRRSSDTEQLAFGEASTSVSGDPAATTTDDDRDGAPDSVPERDDVEHGGAPTDEAWTPDFDEADDLDGLLSARSPLLARAFRGDDRPKH